MYAQPQRLQALTALLLPSAARQDAARAVLVALRVQCDALSAADAASSAQAAANYPLESIGSSVIAAAAPPSLLFPSAARVLLCLSRMRHPATPALLSRLADPPSSFTTSTAIQALRQHLQSPAGLQPTTNGSSSSSSSSTGACPHTDELSVASSAAAHAQAAAADVVALLLLRSRSSSSAAEIHSSSNLLLDLLPLLPPTATPDIITLISSACVVAAAANNDPPRPPTSNAPTFASGDFLRLMALLPSAAAALQLQILTCARSVMQASPVARAVFRSKGAAATAAAVAIMMFNSTSTTSSTAAAATTNFAADAAAAAAASVLPFICSDQLDTPIDTAALPSLFPSAAAAINAAATCARLTPTAVAVVEGVCDMMCVARVFNHL